MSLKKSGVLFWLTVIALLAFISTTRAEIVTITDAGDGTAMYPDPLNPGQLAPALHDVYNREKCYCEADPRYPNNTPEAGLYFHIEYFNHIHQIYFSLTMICKTALGVHKRDDPTCSPSFRYDDDTFARGNHQTLQGCVIHNQTGFEWCYEASKDSMITDMTWVGTKHHGLWYMGDSLFETQAEVIEYCDEQCKENVDPGLTAYKPWDPQRTLNENRVDSYDDGWDDHWY